MMTWSTLSRLAAVRLYLPQLRNPAGVRGLAAGLAGLVAVAGTSAELQYTNLVEIARAGVKSGSIAFKLTTPEELEELLGKPERQEQGRDGDLSILTLEFPQVTASFGRVGEFGGEFLLYSLRVAGQSVDIGRERPIVLRNEADLKHIDAFWGLAGVSLARLDLRDQLKALERYTFDSRTIWPAADKLPRDFVPEQIIERGKDPGLGVRRLHAAGIDGRGIGLAIIDQPLLREHEEYKERVVKYVAVEVEGVPPQMHGPPVASIAVGKSCGVAPGAALYYYAVPAWKWQQNEPWAEQLERIIEFNDQLKDTPKIRVVSISLGAFSERPNYARWKQALNKAKAAGILVVTCDQDVLPLATLRRVNDRAGTDPGDYERGRFGVAAVALCAPAGNRTMASFRGPQVYTYDRMGGLSWTVPYLAGVAALGLQVDPSLEPGDIVRLWKTTASKTKAGSVVNPGAFIGAVKNRLLERP
jgi:hypothetical protein